MSQVNRCCLRERDSELQAPGQALRELDDTGDEAASRDELRRERGFSVIARDTRCRWRYNLMRKTCYHNRGPHTVSPVFEGRRSASRTGTSAMPIEITRQTRPLYRTLQSPLAMVRLPGEQSFLRRRA